MHDRRSALARRRELARLSKPDLIDRIIEMQGDDDSDAEHLPDCLAPDRPCVCAVFITMRVPR